MEGESGSSNHIYGVRILTIYCEKQTTTVENTITIHKYTLFTDVNHATKKTKEIKPPPRKKNVNENKTNIPAATNGTAKKKTDESL